MIPLTWGSRQKAERWGPGAGGQETGSQCLLGKEIDFGKMKKGLEMNGDRCTSV